jgi:PAS domain S-box-containing protein
MNKKLIILIKIVLIVALVELLIMSLFVFIADSLSSWQEATIDVVLLSLLSSAVLYKYVINGFINKTEKYSNKLLDMNNTFSTYVIASYSDLQGRITYASKALCKISGFTEEELVGQPHNILRHKDMPSSVFKEMWETIQSGKDWHGVIKNRTKNGGYYWTKATITMEKDEQDNIIGYRSIRQDITAEKAKEEFTANMSHELRTPLNAIIGFSSILNRKLEENELVSLSKNIYNNSTKLLLLINDILDLSKIKDSSFSLEPYKFDAYKELSEISQQFSGLTIEKRLKYKMNISNKLQGTFFGDWNRINQVCLNIISNSIKFTPKDGEITFKADYLDESLVITISDNGIGMDKGEQDKVFLPYKQADGSTTRKYGGTGLGLSITQNLIEMMSGKITLDSEKGKGSTFKVVIPIEKLSSNTNEIEDVVYVEDKKDTLKGHILIAEDNKTNQMLIRLLIEEFGLTCDIANDGFEAIEMYDSEKYNLVLMDENMPNLNGTEAMKTIKEKHPNNCKPIIALTANAMEGDREYYLQQGMDGYLSKPIDEGNLYNVLVEFL